MLLATNPPERKQAVQRARKVSHHRTWTNMQAKLTTLQAAEPGLVYEHRVNQDAPYMPHEIWQLTTLEEPR